MRESGGVSLSGPDDELSLFSIRQLIPVSYIVCKRVQIVVCDQAVLQLELFWSYC